MKRYLILSQVFPPDPAAVGQYLDEAARAIVAQGQTVTVLTANRGYDDPTQQFPAREQRDGIAIRRLPFASLGKANLFVRVAAQLSFLLQCILRCLFDRRATDLLISTSPPMAGIAAILIGGLRPSLKIHYWLMDLNPDQAVSMGLFPPKHPLVRAMDWINRRILLRANTIIALDRFMVERLKAKLSGPDFPNSKIHIIPPWPMDGHLATVSHTANPFRKAQGWADKKVIMYSGNHSLVHPLDTLLDAAEALQDDPRFIFAFIGGGKGKATVESRIQDRGLTNAVSLPYQPLSEIRYTLSAADLHVISLGNDMSGIVHPCKIYGALKIGRPLLTLGPQASYLDDINDASIGWAVSHGDTQATIAALRAFAEKNEAERTTMGEAANKKAHEQFSRELLLKKFLEAVSALRNDLAP